MKAFLFCPRGSLVNGRRTAGVSPAPYWTARGSGLIACAMILMFAFAAGAAAQDASGNHDQSAILQLEQKWLKALESGDAAALQTILADDWQDNTSLGRIVTRK
jgi:hypothetical protein